MDNFLEINGHPYAIDMDKLMEFVHNGNSVVQTITQNYSVDELGEMKLINKEVSEAKDNFNESVATLRYNMISNILNLILVPISDGTGTVILTEDQNNMHLGQKIAFNTFIEMGIIYEIDNEE